MEIKHVKASEFNNEVLKSDKPVLVDFWADWCGPCKMMSPVVDALAEELDGKVKVCKVNVYEQSALALKYQIMSIPTLVLMNKGIFVKKVIGLQQAEELKEFISDLSGE